MSNPSVTGYGFRQREKGSYLKYGILGDFVEEVLKDRFEGLIGSGRLNPQEDGPEDMATGE